jgi:hypothetical protein
MLDASDRTRDHRKVGVSIMCDIHWVPRINRMPNASFINSRPSNTRVRNDMIVTVKARRPVPDTLDVSIVRPIEGECPVCDE